MPPTSIHSSIAAVGARIDTAIQCHLDRAFRAMMSPGESLVQTPRYLRLITGEPHPFGNCAIVPAPAGLAETREATEPLSALALPAAVMFPGGVTAEQIAYLEGAGFARHEPMPAMAVEIAALTPTSVPAGYSFVSWGNGESERDAWSAALAEGYELPPGVARVFAPSDVTAASSAAQYFAIVKDGKVVGTSMVYLDDGLAGVYCVSTIPAERGKGLGAHATAEALRRAYDLGYRVGVLQSSEAGHSVYLKLGFRDFGGVPLYLRMPG